MKRLFTILFIILIGVTACEDADKIVEAMEDKEALSVTIGAESLSPFSAVLKSKANLGNSVSSDLKIGFQYSKSEGIMPANSTTIEVSEADAN